MSDVSYTYPSIDEILNKHDYTLLDDGCHKVLSVTVDGYDLVYKKILCSTVKREVKSFLRMIEAPIINYYMNKFNFLDYRENASSKEIFDIESRILDSWRERGIPCMQVLERQDDALIYKHLNSINLSKVLKTRDYPNPQYTQMLDVITAIRSVAKSENDALLLHPDLLPKNFLYLLNKRETIAIDPGLKLKNLPFEYLDANINLIFVYDLSQYPSGYDYIKGFLGTLDKNEKDLIRSINTPLSPDAMLYFQLRRVVLDALLGRKTHKFYKIYSLENTFKINDMLRVY